jgi:hypothetical protein
MAHTKFSNYVNDKNFPGYSYIQYSYKEDRLYRNKNDTILLLTIRSSCRPTSTSLLNHNRDTCLPWPSPRQVTDNQTDETIHATNQRHASTPDVIRCSRQELMLLDIIATSIKVKYSYVNTPDVARCSRQELMLLNTIEFSIKVTDIHVNIPGVAVYSHPDIVPLNIIDASIKAHRGHASTQDVAK